MRLLPSLFTVSILLASISCGGGNGGTGPNTQADMTAKIDGQSWASTFATAVRNQNVVIVSGGSSNAIGLAFAIPDQGPGTYTIGASAITNANVGAGGTSWIASAAGGSGSVVVTASSATSIVGTFSFTTAPTAGATPLSRVVTNGKFDVAF
jgi:hypothetical protein